MPPGPRLLLRTSEPGPAGSLDHRIEGDSKGLPGDLRLSTLCLTHSLHGTPLVLILGAVPNGDIVTTSTVTR